MIVGFFYDTVNKYGGFVNILTILAEKGNKGAESNTQLTC